MTLFKAKQISKLLAAQIRVAGFAASGSSNVVTTPITSALSTAGDGGISVPLQVSASSGLGVVTAAPNNRIEIYDATSKAKISSAGFEVYGRLTEAAGVIPSVTSLCLVAVLRLLILGVPQPTLILSSIIDLSLPDFPRTRSWASPRAT